MDDVKRHFFFWQTLVQKHKKHRHLQADKRSAGRPFARREYRPYLSLKAKMLGGHAERIERLGVTVR